MEKMSLFMTICPSFKCVLIGLLHQFAVLTLTDQMLYVIYDNKACPGCWRHILKGFSC